MQKRVLISTILLAIGIIHSGIVLASKNTQPEPQMQSSHGTTAPLPQKKIFKSLSPKEAKQLIETKSDLLLVDVRNTSELNQGSIAGSTLIPLWDIVKGRKTVPDDKPVLLICAVGGRSLALGEAMYRYGYKEVYNLKGGISAWKGDGLPVVY